MAARVLPILAFIVLASVALYNVSAWAAAAENFELPVKPAYDRFVAWMVAEENGWGEKTVHLLKMYPISLFSWQQLRLLEERYRITPVIWVSVGYFPALNGTVVGYVVYPTLVKEFNGIDSLVRWSDKRPYSTVVGKYLVTVFGGTCMQFAPKVVEAYAVIDGRNFTIPVDALPNFIRVSKGFKLVFEFEVNASVVVVVHHTLWVPAERSYFMFRESRVWGIYLSNTQGGFAMGYAGKPGKLLIHAFNVSCESYPCRVRIVVESGGQPAVFKLLEARVYPASALLLHLPYGAVSVASGVYLVRVKFYANVYIPPVLPAASFANETLAMIYWYLVHYKDEYRFEQYVEDGVHVVEARIGWLPPRPLRVYEETFIVTVPSFMHSGYKLYYDEGLGAAVFKPYSPFVLPRLYADDTGIVVYDNASMPEYLVSLAAWVVGGRVVPVNWSVPARPVVEGVHGVRGGFAVGVWAPYGTTCVKVVTDRGNFTGCASGFNRFNVSVAAPPGSYRVLGVEAWMSDALHDPGATRSYTRLNETVVVKPLVVTRTVARLVERTVTATATTAVTATVTATETRTATRTLVETRTVEKPVLPTTTLATVAAAALAAGVAAGYLASSRGRRGEGRGEKLAKR